MVPYAGVAFVILASAMWMAIAPQLPPFRERRDALAGITWFVSRGLCALVLLGLAADPGMAWGALLAVAGFGAFHPGAGAAPFAGPIDLPPGGAWRVPLAIGVDFVAWRALAAAEGDEGEAAWNWVASPLVLGIGVLFAAPRGAAVALVAVAHLLQRRGFGVASGLVTGLAAAWGGPAALAAAVALAFAPGRTPARALCTALAGGAALAALRFLAPHAWNWAWLPPAEPGGGVSLWRLAHAGSAFVPGEWGWLPVAALLLAGCTALARRGAGAPALAAWTFGVFAVFAPSFPVREALPFAPLLAVWAADDPDRRGWWFLEGFALALCVVLELLATRTGDRTTWRFIGIAGIAGTALLALWPLRETLREPRGA
jgi:hypothetical protein